MWEALGAQAERLEVGRPGGNYSKEMRGWTTKKTYEYKIFTIQRNVLTLKAHSVKHYSNKNPIQKHYFQGPLILTIFFLME